MPVQEIQEKFRCAFERWGKPLRIRVDNGMPWGSWNDLPPALALWWWGLGIEVVWNPPRKPQWNGIVERSQGVLQQWAEPEKWHTLEEAREKLAWAVEMQRERYKGADGKTRLERYPELLHNERRYRKQEELRTWDLSQVDKWLTQRVWERKVGKNGQISLYNYAYSVGRQYAREKVHLQWDKERREWLVRDQRGQQIKTIKPKHFDAEAIWSLNISRKKGYSLSQT